MAEYYLEKRREETAGAEAEEEDDMLPNFIKKRKLCPQLESPENSVSSAASVACGCSPDEGDESSDGVAVVSPDLECKILDAEISVAISFRIDREFSPTSETCTGDSEQSSQLQESTPHAVSPRRTRASSTSGKTPYAAEIEEFFAAAEKYEQKRFAEKYNYDITKDVPLQGKYEWVPLNQNLLLFKD